MRGTLLQKSQAYGPGGAACGGFCVAESGGGALHTLQYIPLGGTLSLLSVEWFVQARGIAGRYSRSTPAPITPFVKERTDMCGPDSRTELPLAAPETSGCSCCSPGARAQTPVPVEGFEYLVEGLTCGHCVQTVEKAVSAVPGVESATLDLVAGGISRLRVAGKVAGTAVRDAVTDAGYSVTADN